MSKKCEKSGETINRPGAMIEIDGRTFTIGAKIRVVESDYKWLTGTIVEIMTGDEKQTDNDGNDIACELDIPTEAADVKRFEEIFSALYQEPKQLDDVGLDYVIFCADDLEIL